jgi:hypothetical protein
MTQDAAVAPDATLDRTGIIAALRATERDVASFFESLSDAELGTRVGDGWTPVEHLDHLNIAVAAVARGFSMSRWMLRLRFGASRRGSRSMDQLRSDYVALLGAGAGASGPFVPERNAEIDVSERRRTLLERWHRVNARLSAAVEGWSEKQLDRIRFPHPILGMLTARELLYFTTYHGYHHIAAAQRRLARHAPTTAV